VAPNRQLQGHLATRFLGPGDSENGNRLRSGDKLIFFDATGTEMRPNVAKGWEVSQDGRQTTLFLREGMKWSDGAPYKADDFVFWFEDIYQNKDIVSSPAPELQIDRKPGKLVTVDEITVRFEFEEPYHLFLNLVDRRCSAKTLLAPSSLKWGRLTGAQPNPSSTTLTVGRRHAPCSAFR